MLAYGPAQLPSLPVILVAPVVFVVVLRLWQAFVSDPLRHIPGPFLARFTRLWLCVQYAKGDFETTNTELHRKYGPIVRIAPHNYSVDSPAAAKVIYGSGNRFLKTDWYSSWGQPGHSNLFNELDPKKHAEMRRQVANTYSMSSMVSYEPFVDECTEILCQRLSECAEAGTWLDMGHWFQCYAFDVIGKITLSRRFGNLDAGGDFAGIMDTLEKASFLSSTLGLFPFWCALIVELLVKLTTDPKRPQGPLVVGQWTKEMIHTRSLENKKPRADDPEDFLDKFMRLRKERPEAITEDAIRVAVGANVGAGSDTTSVSLSATLYHLCRNPMVLQKLRDELDQGLTNGTVSDPITFRQAQSLPYLQAVIKESLRIHPATGYTMPRIVPPEGQKLVDEFFPGGHVVGINPWVAHRNKQVFGEDADMFRPERWLEAKAAGSESALDAYFLTFGQGSRTCIGKHLSLLEITKTIPRIIQRFDFGLEAGAGGTSALKCVNWWFVKPKGFRCSITARKIKK